MKTLSKTNILIYFAFQLHTSDLIAFNFFIRCRDDRAILVSQQTHTTHTPDQTRMNKKNYYSIYRLVLVVQYD